MDIKNRLKQYINSNFDNGVKRCFSKVNEIEEFCDYDCILDNEFRSNNEIDKFIDNNKNDNKFHTLLFKLIDEKGLKDSDVYNKAHIDRRLFSKIRSDIDYHPSKETILLLGFALEVDEDVIIELLESASYSLPKNNVYDLIIRFCFVEKIYDVISVNQLLDDYDCKLLAY